MVVLEAVFDLEFTGKPSLSLDLKVTKPTPSLHNGLVLHRAQCDQFSYCSRLADRTSPFYLSIIFHHPCLNYSFKHVHIEELSDHVAHAS